MTSRLLVLREEHARIRGSLSSAIRAKRPEQAKELAHDYLRLIEQIVIEQNKPIKEAA